MSYISACCRSVVVLSLAFAIGACGDDGGGGTPDATPVVYDAAVPDASLGPAPALFTPRDDLGDDELATMALALLGESSAGGSDNCNNCHGLTRQNM